LAKFKRIFGSENFVSTYTLIYHEIVIFRCSSRSPLLEKLLYNQHYGSSGHEFRCILNHQEIEYKIVGLHGYRGF